MKRVYNLKEAEEFFLTNSSGNVECFFEFPGIPDCEKKVCNTFPECKEFFEKWRKEHDKRTT